MNLAEWSKCGVDYSRKLVDSALDGARAGEDEFLRAEPLAPYLTEAARQALKPTLFGVCIGMLGGLLHRRRSPARVLASGLVGGAIGFGAGMIWDSRELTTRMASSAWKSISKTRDEHWFEKNPIDYA